MSDNEKEYIVTQNPLENTIDDFWHMIWQENVNHIVMISSPNEEFVYYWPKLKSDLVCFDDIRVSLKEICHNKFYIHRKLQVQRKERRRQVDFVDIKIRVSWKVVFKISNYLYYFSCVPNPLIS
jgi:protein tyrosine phosphatase